MSAKRLPNIILILCIALPLIVLAVDLISLWVSSIEIQDIAGQAARYTSTGQYDQEYCIDLDGDNTPCGGASKDKEKIEANQSYREEMEH